MAHAPPSPSSTDVKIDEMACKDGSSTLDGEHLERHGSIPDTHEAYRKLVRRLDRRLIVTTGFMYAVSLVDRTNIGSANIAGMSKDLGLDIGYRYVSLLGRAGVSLILINPVDYCACFLHLVHHFSAPSHHFMPKDWSQDVPARHHPGLGNPAGEDHLFTLSVIPDTAYQRRQIGFGFPKDWQTLAGLRFVLGALEGGFLPCCLFLISTWYVRYDLQKRVTAFYAIGFVSSGFGGILAYGLTEMVCDDSHPTARIII